MIGKARFGGAVHALAEHQLIRYDDRGTGFSDRRVDDISFENVRLRS